MAETFEEKMLRFRDISLKFQITVVKSLMSIEKKLNVLTSLTYDELIHFVSNIILKPQRKQSCA
jgi:hypothetical protein